jgi:hypothetical protein
VLEAQRLQVRLVIAVTILCFPQLLLPEVAVVVAGQPEQVLMVLLAVREAVVLLTIVVLVVLELLTKAMLVVVGLV